MADDELNQTENQNPPEVEELGQIRARISELEGLVAQKDEGLTKANAHIIELEQALAKGVASYKALVVQSNPEVLGELITGDTIESIDESLGKAKTLISRVRQGLEAEISSAKVPAGAPQRTPPDLSALSPREKIQYAIGGKQ